MKTMNRKYGHDRPGWSLIELMVVILIIGLLVAFMAPRLVSRMLTQARVAACRQQMSEIKIALVGDPTLVVEGEMISLGYHGDVGSWPPSWPGDTMGFHYLTFPPPGIPAWDPYTKHGWHGPYLHADTSASARDIQDDPWENPYQYIRDANGNPIGILSAGPDGDFVSVPGGPDATLDNIRVMF
jgi:general secretion pathway protein G